MTVLRLAVNAVVRKDERARFTLAERISGLIYPKYKFSEYGRIFLDDHDFLAYYEAFEGDRNYHSMDRKYVVDQFMKLVLSLDGDTAECGAFKGATSYLICQRTQGSGKQHFIFDSFEGLSTPLPSDGSYWKAGDLFAPEEILRKNLRQFDFVVSKKGWIPERFQEVADRRFCFLHLDVDLQQPTWDSLEFFYPRMARGGIVVCDDYGFSSCPGVKQAMDSFFQDKPEQIVQLPTGQAFTTKA